MNLRESERVPLQGVEGVEHGNSGKKVADAWLYLEERHGPTPARRVVCLETRDGAVYRFQRYSTDEYLAFYNRENPDGSEFERAAQLPEHVEDVRESIMDREVLPDFEALIRAEAQVGERDLADLEAETVEQVAADGGVDEWLPPRERGTLGRGGKSWVAHEERLREPDYTVEDAGDDWPGADGATRLSGGDAE